MGKVKLFACFSKTKRARVMWLGVYTCVLSLGRCVPSFDWICGTVFELWGKVKNLGWHRHRRQHHGYHNDSTVFLWKTDKLNMAFENSNLFNL